METAEQGLVETAESAILKMEPPSDVWETKDTLSGDASSEPRHLSLVPERVTMPEPSEQRYEYLYTALRTIRSVNQFITQEKDRDRLVQGVCDKLLEVMGYSHIWIVLLDDEEEVESVAEAGIDPRCAALTQQIKKGKLNDCMQRALKQSEAVTGENGADGCVDCPIQGKVQGKRAMTARIAYDDRIYGLISVLRQPGLVTEKEEQELLGEIASDLSFALHGHEVEEERKLADRRVRRNIREKELLLKEIHHRVKNNMQIICSLIYLQSVSIDDEKSLGLLTECLNRVKSMALIHEELYRSNDFSIIKFKNYIEDLVRKLHKTYPLDYDKIKINMLVDDISLSVEHAIPCGLIINELLTNALKYAFPESFEGIGEITISMQKTEDGEIELFVQDNGVGFPEDFDLESAETCGMEIVKVLAADQLEGRYELQRNGITKFYICFSQPAEWID